MTPQERENRITPIPMPIGIITDHQDNAITFHYTRPGDHLNLPPGSPFVIWNWDGQAYAAGCGEITENGPHEAAGIITHTDRQPDWPFHRDPFGRGMPVYGLAPGQEPEQAMENFLPDPRRMATLAELRYLLQLAEQHKQATGIPIHNESLVRQTIAYLESHPD